MIRVIYCDNCGNDTLDTITVNVSLTENNFCDKCHRHNPETTTYFFCSEYCFGTYIRKVVEYKAEFKVGKNIYSS